MDEPPTVGVITPFREQVALLSKMVLAQPKPAITRKCSSSKS